jgi:hypothetical protein
VSGPTFRIIRTVDRYAHRVYWTACTAGAQETAEDPWSALAACVALWHERGRPTGPDGDDWTGPDWIVTSIEDLGRGEFYRWRVEGINVNCAPGAYGREFVWRVPEHPSTNRRYDLSRVARDPGHRSESLHVDTDPRWSETSDAEYV